MSAGFLPSRGSVEMQGLLLRLSVLGKLLGQELGSPPTAAQTGPGLGIPHHRVRVQGLWQASGAGERPQASICCEPSAR